MYILFIITLSYTNIVSTQEFSNKASCEAASVMLQEHSINRVRTNSWCISK